MFWKYYLPRKVLAVRDNSLYPAPAVVTLYIPCIIHNFLNGNLFRELGIADQAASPVAYFRLRFGPPFSCSVRHPV